MERIERCAPLDSDGARLEFSPLSHLMVSSSSSALLANITVFLCPCNRWARLSCIEELGRIMADQRLAGAATSRELGGQVLVCAQILMGVGYIVLEAFHPD